jgi:hypothetical protein
MDTIQIINCVLQPSVDLPNITIFFSNDRAQKIKNLTALGQYLTTDLKEGCVPSHKLFEECLEVNYAKHAFEIYEKQVKK